MIPMNQSALVNAVCLKQDLYHVHNLFHVDTLNTILQQAELQKDWQPVLMQEGKTRKALIWSTNGLLDQIWCLLNELDYSKFRLKFTNVSLWKDQHPYFIGQHVDNNGIHAAMQIYLSNGPKELGTWFEDIEIPFVQNTGYIMNNRNKLKHGMKVPVPDGVVRYSIYALFDYV